MEGSAVHSPAEPGPTPESPPTRRRVLAIGAVAGAAGAASLAGCGSGGETANPPQDEGGSAAGPGPGTRLVAAAKVPVGGGIVLDQAKVVVTQPSSGTFEAFSAICTHLQCLVGRVADGVISCPCHGSAYSAKDGSVRQGPATTPLPKVPIKVEGGEVVQA